MSKRFLIIDGSSFIYRAYYAIQHLSNSKGQPTNAIYGFIAILQKLLAEENPEYIAICFDRKEATFRHEKYEDYKAHRKPMPDDLVEQIPYIKKLVKAFNIASFEKAGFEADDIIGTLAIKAAKKDVDVFIVTGDKDILQLVNDKIKVINVHKEGLVYDIKKVKERYSGLGPEKMIDIMALMGDGSDNIPGIPGVGEKTAIKLILEFGSLEGVYEHIEDLKGNLKLKLIENKKLADLSRELATIDCDVPVDFSLTELKAKEKDTNALKELYTELEFSKLLSQLGTMAVEKKSRKKSYSCITDEKDLSTLIKRLENVKGFAVDTETTGTDPHSADLLGISISLAPHEAYYIPYALHAEQSKIIHNSFICNQLQRIFENEYIAKYGQNIKYDLIVLERHGMTLRGIAFDTMVASYLLDPNRSNHNLDMISLDHVGIKKIAFEDLVGKGKNQVTLDQVPIEKVTEYACEDADCVLQLVPILRALLKKNRLEPLFDEIEMPLLSVLATMEMNGVKIDTKFLGRLSKEAAKELKALEKAIYAEAEEEFNINSPKQVSHILFEKLKLPIIKKTKTGLSTNVAVLEQLAVHHPLPRLLLDYREIAKLKSTYLDALPLLVNKETGLVHTSFNQTITSTGRLSSSNPNFQNIPIRTETGRRVREAFVPRAETNILLAADYSQIELRILAHLSKDKSLQDAFAKNIDVHSFTASLIFDVPIEIVDKDMRNTAKVINFSVIYGKTAYGLSQDLGLPVREAGEFINEYFNRYKGVKKYLDLIKDMARKEGFTETIVGRKCLFPDINSSNANVRQFAERAAVNAPIQGSAADLIKIAMLHIQAAFEEHSVKTKMILQVHDELVFDVVKNERATVEGIVREKMENALELTVPLVVDLSWGKNWAEK
ncbi:MAG: DNA polymerase I [Candidatus Omnitrophica bacterium]|nr:DNA polymerase I [Candidatus Omnitrophota bacterium]